MKHTSQKKLLLNKETLKLLGNRDLDRIAGGRMAESRDWNCLTDLCTQDLFCPTATGSCP